MLFQQHNAASLDEILKIPIPYTEDLEETEFEKFQKKVQKGKVIIPAEELEEHIEKYYKRKDGTDNMWMQQIHPDPKQYYLEKKLEALRDPPRPDELFRLCFATLLHSLQDIYHQDFMSMLPLCKWQEFIEEFSSQIMEFVNELDPSLSSPEKARLCEKRAYAIIGMFHFQYSFYNIHRIFKDTEMTDFQKIRSIRNFLLLQRSDKKIRSEYYDFELEQWKYFFEIEDDYCFGRINLDRYIQKVLYCKPLKPKTATVIETSSNYYKFFGWKKISLQSFDNQVIPLTEFIIKNYFHRDSHFEDNIFWFLNQYKYIVYYDNERANEDLYEQHKNNINIEKSILNCPVKYIPKHDMNRLYSFCISNFQCAETWKFLLKSHSSISFETLLKNCFNIIGRLSYKYDCSSYHYSLQEKMRRNILNKKKLYKCKEKILFPELYFNDTKTRELFAVVWEKSFAFFVSDFFNFFLDRQDKNILFVEKISSFIQPTIDLTCYIGTENLYTVLEKKKTYLEYFNTKNLFQKKEVVDTEKQKLSKDLYIKTIDSYISSLMEKEVK